MGRRIVTTSYQSTGASVDTYFDRVVKYIPADIVSAWVAVTGLISSDAGAPQPLLLWIAFVVTIGLTILWTLKQTAVAKQNGTGSARTQTAGKDQTAMTQALVSAGSFTVWVFALGGPFATLGFYRPLYGSLLLIFYTLAAGLIIPGED